jgi:hypothetical protein
MKKYKQILYDKLMELKLAFYAYFYGSDSNIRFQIPELPSLKYPCYFYTNNQRMLEQLKETGWISIFQDISSTDDLIESCMLGKRIKTQPTEYEELKPYDYLCYLDTTLDKVSETFVEDFIRKYFIENNYALLLRQHVFIHDCNVWNEYHESMKQERYQKQADQYCCYIHNQVSKGLNIRTDYHCQCGFLIRNMKHEKINDINTTWYRHIQECGIQDQISFFFVKQLFPEYIHAFSEIPFVF